MSLPVCRHCNGEFLRARQARRGAKVLFNLWIWLEKGSMWPVLVNLGAALLLDT